MSENKRKTTEYDALRALIFKQLANKHNCSIEFVRKSVADERHSEKAQLIKKEYPGLYQLASNAINQPANNH